MNLLDQIQVTPLSRISTAGGDVLHVLKSTEDSFQGFGEAYLSWITSGAIKGWKQHIQMTMNLVVPFGSVRFVFHDLKKKIFREEMIGEQQYQRLTVPPKIWYGFQGKSLNSSLIINMANLPHSPEEVEHKELDMIQFDWRDH